MRFLLGNPLLIEEFGTVDVLIYGDFLHTVLDNAMTIRGDGSYAEIYKSGSLIGRRKSEKEIELEDLSFEPIKGFKIFLGINDDLKDMDNFRLAFYFGIPLIVIFTDRVGIDKDEIFAKFWPIAQDNFSVVVSCVKDSNSNNFFYSVYVPMELTLDKTGIICSLQPYYYFEFNFSLLNQLKRKDPIYSKMKEPTYFTFLKRYFND
ncbi:MAG TPA: hypothetical protein ENF81_07025 [Thermotogaceae bacterium]|nr:hypothetical protein [Thermotogota bacterium]HEW92277.1 hypothetical protein [Thermotogaceae bacterium]